MPSRHVARLRVPANPYARVERLLGPRSLHIGNPIELHERIAKGFPRWTMVHLVENLTILTLAESFKALNVSQRTWHRIKAQKHQSAPLDTDQSARVWNLAEVLSRAQEVLGGREDAEQWMATPAIGLNARRPIDLLATPQGAEMVKTLLDQMAHGVYA
jgi:putative toxin-antitoxin system antitoxin component (TIGR02293 family)